MRQLALTFILVFLALPAIAQEFTIESVDVAPGARVSADIVRTETRLVTGRAYTEEEIRQAVNRIRRLPFVLGASYTLERGASPDARRLVITLHDLKPFFYDVEVIGVTGSSGRGSGVWRGGLGGRWFAGPRGVVEATIGSAGTNDSLSDFTDVGLAYRHYGLFGTAAYFAAGLSHNFGEGETESDPSPRLEIGVPVGLTQTIVGTLRHLSLSRDRRFGTTVVPLRSETTEAEVLWVADTRDDLYFITRGTHIEVGPTYAQRTGNAVTLVAPGTPRVAGTTADVYGARATLEHYRPFGNWIGFGTADVRTMRTETTIDRTLDVDVTDSSAQATLGVARNFGSLAGMRGRWELGAGARHGRSDRIGRTFSDTHWLAEGALVLRHRWGTARVGLQYIAD